jgi:hypothetical protein
MYNPHGPFLRPDKDDYTHDDVLGDGDTLEKQKPCLCPLGFSVRLKRVRLIPLWTCTNDSFTDNPEDESSCKQCNVHLGASECFPEWVGFII